MEAIRIEILNPKAMQLINSLQDLKLIKVKKEPASLLKTYLQKMRKQTDTAPTLEEIATIVEEERTKRYAKK